MGLLYMIKRCKQQSCKHVLTAGPLPWLYCQLHYACLQRLSTFPLHCNVINFVFSRIPHCAHPFGEQKCQVLWICLPKSALPSSSILSESIPQNLASELGKLSLVLKLVRGSFLLFPSRSIFLLKMNSRRHSVLSQRN